MTNLVQAEFFHVGGTEGSLEELEVECTGRLLDGAPLKTVVRFYDESGSVTEFTERYENASRKRVDSLAQYHKSRGWGKLWASLQVSKAFRDSIAPEERLACAKESFLAIAETSKVIAVEQFDHTFRPINDNELYDLTVAVGKAKGAWIFVFAHNDLCADQNTVVSHAI